MAVPLDLTVEYPRGQHASSTSQPVTRKYANLSILMPDKHMPTFQIFDTDYIIMHAFDTSTTKTPCVIPLLKQNLTLYIKLREPDGHYTKLMTVVEKHLTQINGYVLSILNVTQQTWRHSISFPFYTTNADFKFKEKYADDDNTLSYMDDQLYSHLIFYKERKYLTNY
jgi:hypothetical protein